MQTATNPKSDKTNTFKLSQQVREILYKSGYSFLFNFDDYKQYKKRAKHEFNKALAIAQYFIQDNNQPSDFNEYEF